MNWLEEIGRLTGSRVASAKQLAGDMGGASMVVLADGRRLVAKQGAGGAAKEAAMLRALAASGAPVPAIGHNGAELLLMEFVESGEAPCERGWRHLAQVLDRLHQPAGETYGWTEDDCFGEVAIRNARSEDWLQFWGEHRLAVHAPHVGAALGKRVEAVVARLADLLPERPSPALLHGDLWGGNMLFADGRLAALIDPACYYGDREVDVAMLTLFDHPPETFFAALSLEHGWRERLPVYRLWPLLVHLRLFGPSYRPAVVRALEACGA